MNLHAADVYTDFSSFARLRADAREGTQQAREQVAQQAEALLFGLVIKSMREAGAVFGASTGAGVPQDLYDSQLALTLARGGRLGFAQTMLRELEPAGPAAAGARAASGEVSGAALGPEPHALALRNAALGARDWAQVRAAVAHARGSLDAGGATSGSSAAAAASQVRGPAETEAASWDSPQAFVRALWPAASRAASALGTRAEAIVAVAALETGWGRYMPARADGSSSNNLFGIKAHGWHGDVTHAPTLEFEDGAFARRVEPFRAYPSPQAAVEDFTRFIATQPRYRATLASGGDAVKFVHALHAAGYATDPRYAQKLEALLDSAPIKQAAAAAGTPSA